MRSLWKRAALVAGVLVVAVAPWSEAQTMDGAAQEASVKARAEAVTTVRDMLLKRSVRKVDPKIAEADARRIVSKLSEEQVGAVLDGQDLVSIFAADKARMSAAVTAPSDASVTNVSAKALGDPESELLFVPVEPCRIIDTRVAGGPVAANTNRDFRVTGTTGFEAQGGNAGGCGIPIGSVDPLAPAVVINFIAVGPSGPGNLRAWEFGQPIPRASVINYANVTGLNIANGVIVPVAGVSTAASDMHIRADAAGTHVVADVTGYFTRFPTEEFQGGLQTKLVTTANSVLVDLGDGGCKELTTCTVTTTAPGQVMIEAWAQVVAGHTSGTEDRFVMQLETAASVSCPEDDSVNASDYEIPAALGTNADVDFTLSHARVFAQAAGQTRTYRLSGRMVNGANVQDQVENSRVLCTFIPD
ncbi:MAG TPA: hypothetical protein VEL74_21295 [Thermoanaerobaculia bacterium]|nr:hypothetical protein [Thermoanaerobaculia bacterium]